MAEPDNVALAYALYDGDTGEPTFLKSDKVTPATAASSSSGGGLTKPHRLAVVGDSIALEWGRLATSSPLMWSLARVPRVFDYHQGNLAGTDVGGNHAVSGSKSGTLLSTTGTTVYTALTTDLNTPTKLAALQAWAPTVLLVVTGTNDAGAYANLALDATYNNVKAAVDALPTLQYAIIVPILPKTGSLAAGASDAIMAYRNMLRAWERRDKKIRIFDPSVIMLDETQTSYAASGGSGLAGAMTADNLHPSVVFGRASADMLTQLFDDMLIHRAYPMTASQVDVYSASSTYGNALGTAGAFIGTAGTLGANASGVVATGWTLATTNAELTVTGSKSTFNVRGYPHTSQLLTFAAGAPLTAGRNCTLIRQINSAAGFALALRQAVQVIAQFKDLVGCTSINLNVTSQGGTQSPVINFGINANQSDTASADLPTSATAETLELLFPGYWQAHSSNTGFTFTLTVKFRSGTTPAGTVAFSQAGVWAIPD
jgi:hypothetical protein